MEDNLKSKMETKAKCGELKGISKNAVFDKDGKLFLDMY